MTERIKLNDDTIEPAQFQLLGNASKYKPEYARMAKVLAQRGAIQSELADAFNVSTKTIQNWMAQIPEFQDAVNVGVDSFNTRVERSLAECATGYWMTWEESVKLTKRYPNGVIEERIEQVIQRKYYPPIPTCQIFYLKNRVKERWRDVQEHKIEGELPTPEFLMDQLKERILRLHNDGMLQLPAPKLKEINPKSNGKGNGHG